MKRIILIIGIITSLFSMPLNAAQKRAEIHERTHDSIRGQRERAPLQLPTIDIIYGCDTRMVEINCSTDSEAQVYVYNESGELIDSADTLSATLYLPPAPATTYHIILESKIYNWQHS